MSPAAQAEIEALAADFEPWHFYWSIPSQGRQPRVWAARALPTGSGETVDADTPAGMRKLLEERS